MHSFEQFDSFMTICSKSQSQAVTLVATSSQSPAEVVLRSDNTKQIQTCERRRAPHGSHRVTVRGTASPPQLA